MSNATDEAEGSAETSIAKLRVNNQNFVDLSWSLVDLVSEKNSIKGAFYKKAKEETQNKQKRWTPDLWTTGKQAKFTVK